MNVPFYTSTREYEARKAEFNAAVMGVMERGDFILGEEVAAFEREAAEFLGTRYAVGVASGSDALVIGSDILGFKDGAEVLTPTFTFFASTSCVARLGGKPVLVDMDPETLNMDLADAERKVTKKTVGIIPVAPLCATHAHAEGHGFCPRARTEGARRCCRSLGNGVKSRRELEEGGDHRGHWDLLVLPYENLGRLWRCRAHGYQR